MQFLFAELGTSGSVDGSRRLVIKGRFQQKQIENVLRRYIGMLLFAPLEYLNTVADSLQSNMLPAKPAAAPTRNSTRVRTACTSSPATPAVPVGRSPPSRLVSVDRSAAERDKAKRGCGWVGIYMEPAVGRYFSFIFSLFISPIFVQTFLFYVDDDAKGSKCDGVSYARFGKIETT